MDRTLIAVQNYDIYGYLKNSMNRFGDDLTEEILQYLTFEDKIRFECVSKQWKRCVYPRQYGLEILPSYEQTKDSLIRLYPEIWTSSLSVNIIAFESVLKKCPKIKKFYFETRVDSSVLSLIGRYCPNIKSLKFINITIDNKIVDFFRITTSILNRH